MSSRLQEINVRAKTGSFINEFKAFVVKGNAIDLAVGVVIGAAFNEVVNSLVKDIILGTITTLAKQPDFSTLAYGSIRYGAFINTLLNLVIVGLSVFVAIKFVNRLARKHRDENASANGGQDSNTASATE